MNVLAITQHNGIRIAELGFLLGAVGGAVLTLDTITGWSGRRFLRFVASALLTAGSVLLLIATRWGHFG